MFKFILRKVDFMNENLYHKTVTCPVCNRNFEITKVRSKACKVQSRDTDFCVYYEGLNPIFYDVFVCEYCGYASQSDKFEHIKPNDARLISEMISPRWTKRSFSGERNIDNAIETFKLCLLNLQTRKAASSDIAKVCIRLAWLYRLKKDKRENDFLEFALKSYIEAYNKESFPIDKFDESTCMYMIAELNRRVEKYDESIKWFSRLISFPESRKQPALLEKARDQYHMAKEQASKLIEN